MDDYAEVIDGEIQEVEQSEVADDATKLAVRCLPGRRKMYGHLAKHGSLAFCQTTVNPENLASPSIKFSVFTARTYRRL